MCQIARRLLVCPSCFKTCRPIASKDVRHCLEHELIPCLKTARLGRPCAVEDDLPAQTTLKTDDELCQTCVSGLRGCDFQTVQTKLQGLLDHLRSLNSNILAPKHDVNGIEAQSHAHPQPANENIELQGTIFGNKIRTMGTQTSSVFNHRSDFPTSSHTSQRLPCMSTRVARPSSLSAGQRDVMDAFRNGAGPGADLPKPTRSSFSSQSSASMSLEDEDAISPDPRPQQRPPQPQSQPPHEFSLRNFNPIAPAIPQAPFPWRQPSLQPARHDHNNRELLDPHQGRPRLDIRRPAPRLGNTLESGLAQRRARSSSRRAAMRRQLAFLQGTVALSFDSRDGFTKCTVSERTDLQAKSKSNVAAPHVQHSEVVDPWSRFTAGVLDRQALNERSDTF